MINCAALTAVHTAHQKQLWPSREPERLESEITEWHLLGGDYAMQLWRMGIDERREEGDDVAARVPVDDLHLVGDLPLLHWVDRGQGLAVELVELRVVEMRLVEGSAGDLALADLGEEVGWRPVVLGEAPPQEVRAEQVGRSHLSNIHCYSGRLGLLGENL